ncbi:NAD(P)H-binding protein [Loktanella sp. TSTF-M6]|uniref:NAD(P)H-binding protein n=1 Tax=Loktanella gaetbuli TaxID=2881335 RepID=A0ABS8BXN2_9RHOB|nr:NAD(P)H-binding protein [Loktanella gaetbuli]MCB5200492.1 NAD(P)H-binding protein [Loktanella gaetbuli]
MILVTTPSGDIGARVLSRLAQSVLPLRVVVRDPAKIPRDLIGRVDIIEGSHGDPSVIAQALAKIESVFWLPPGSPASASAHEAYVDFSRPFCAALASSQVRHVVGVSAFGRGWPKSAGHVTASLRMDDMIAESGVAYRALACASLMDNLLRQTDVIRDGGAFYQPTAEGLELPHVAKADIADVAAHLLINTDWSGVDAIPLLGPENLSFAEMADVMTSVLGRPIRFQEMSMDDFGGMMQAVGASEGMAAAMVEMFTAKNEGMDNMVEPPSRANTPTTFRQWCEEELRPVLTNSLPK